MKLNSGAFYVQRLPLRLCVLGIPIVNTMFSANAQYYLLDYQLLKYHYATILKAYSIKRLLKKDWNAKVIVDKLGGTKAMLSLAFQDFSLHQSQVH
ncbi:hypothetical protein [Bacillus sp. T33-2]|uniref:hypothetical protein n=1 Tax=Bacillus sp. T33-2 TaxID=2054168 RepID=UPI000C76FBAF|nr:hypothetical protein [Bacillus sp. T33-2]PLR99245.1 hypothetical protein CVD19_02715 [Bacillus sp. T33-2]